LITFDATRVAKSVSYYAQQIFATNLGTHVLTSTPAQGTGNSGLYWVASVNQNTGAYILKVVNTGASAVSATINLSGFTVSTSAVTTTITSSNAMASNTLDAPNTVVPTSGTQAVTNGNTFTRSFGPYSITAIVMPKAGTTATSTSSTSKSSTATTTTTASGW
jgi:alpha-N-arabinofuranosidase